MMPSTYVWVCNFRLRAEKRKISIEIEISFWSLSISFYKIKLRGLYFPLDCKFAEFYLDLMGMFSVVHLPYFQQMDLIVDLFVA